jgi:glycosyltransferase involved in cell wall biosynthesis
MAPLKKTINLVHITTVPISLFFLSGQVRYMKSRGFNVHAVSSPGEGLTRFGQEEGIPVHGIPMFREISPFKDLVALAKIFRLFRTIRPDIVHSHTPKGGLLGMTGSWLARVPNRFYHIHGLPYMTTTGWKRQILVWSERLSCTLAGQVLCVSKSIRELAIADRICPESKIKVLSNGSINGVDAENRFNPQQYLEQKARIRLRHGIPQEAVVLGFVGRLVLDKGIAELAQAWGVLREEFPNLHLLLVGPSESTDAAIFALLNGLQRDERVHFTGMLWDTAEIYAAIDIVILPTYREGFPVVPLEAAAMALPVISTKVPGCIDAIEDDVTGLLVPVHNVEALIDAVRTYVRQPLLRHQHGQAARERVLRDFRPGTLWSATYNEYINAMRRV